MPRKLSETLRVFEKFTVIDGNMKIDTSGLFSKSCYEEWLTTRKAKPKDSPHAFRKSVTGHCKFLK